MSIKVYAHEILDGVAERVKAQASVAYTSSIVPSKEVDNVDLSVLIEKDKLALASSNPKQPDLFYLKSILVSTGWNLNDDVFLPEELWASRHTPEDKQFNFMHNDMDIIGHITSNQAVDLSGNAIPDEIETLPEQFNILVDAVIYRGWSQQEQRERIEKIISEILNDEWFVSMETTFGNFDYAIKDKDGVCKVVERGEASAFLTKHLRAYGGTGEYNGYTVGRVLRNMVFAGKGLVNKPANPPSIIILEDEDNRSTSTLRENDMPVDTAKQIEELQAELTAAKAAVESLGSFKTKVEALEATVTEKDAAIASANSKISELEAAIATLQQTVDALTSEKTTLASQLQEIETKAKAERRKSALVEAGVDAEELEETLASLEAIDDAAFDKVVSAMKKNMKKKMEEKPEEDDCEASLESVEEETEASVTETETPDNAGELRSAASSWFANNVLETTKKK
jgi:hypothetical protein